MTPIGASVAQVEAALGQLLPAGIEVCAGRIGEVELDVTPEEVACVGEAAPARRQEFLTGRSLARGLLRRLGVPDRPLLRSVDRAPRWPTGIVGSIAHTGSLCVVAAAPASLIRSVGLDVEPDAPLELRVWSRICTAQELVWLGGCPEGARGLLARRIFSAKEAFYKAQHPLTSTFLGFRDVELRISGPDLGSGCFSLAVPAAIRGRVRGSGDDGEIGGAFAAAGGHVLAALSLG